MLHKLYICEICKTTPDQISHHKAHLKTQKHQDKKEIVRMKLLALSTDELVKIHNNTNIDDIVKKIETKIYSHITETNKMKRTNAIVFELTETETKTNVTEENFKNEYRSFLSKMHNLLRGSAVTGDTALDDILYAFMLCYLEDKLDKFQDVSLYGNELTPRKIKDFVNYLSVNFLLGKTDELRLPKGKNAIEIAGELLSRHPMTKNLIKDKDFMNCTDPLILSQLLRDVQQFTKDNNVFKFQDLVGVAYEFFINQHKGNQGREMGQYFTERPLMRMCFELIDAEDLKMLKIDDNSTIGDEFCATFGFPLCLKAYLSNKFKINIQDKNIYGVEYHDKLYRFAGLNAMFSLGDFKNVIKGNSFETNISEHLDISVHNVPFGSSMKYKFIEESYNKIDGLPDFKTIIPIKKNKDTILASQLVLYKTKKMGLLIIKDGEETSGISNTNYRKYFCDNCVIKKIMKIPSGIFTSTGTKTVCIYFIKQKGKSTENIQFVELNDKCNKITEICRVSIEDLKLNNYSWNANVYLIDETIEKMKQNADCKFVKLGDVCDFKNGRQLPKNKFVDGIYPVIGGGKTPVGYHNAWNTEKNAILCASSGSAGYISKYKTKIWASDCFSICSKDITILDNVYLYYYLKHIQEQIYKCQTGAAQPHVYSSNIGTMIVPLPLIDTQQEVSTMLSDLDKQKKLLSKRKDGINRQMTYFVDVQIKKHYGDIKFKTFGEMCDFKNGRQLSKNKFANGKYPVIGGGKTPVGYHNEWNMPKNTILCASSGSAGYISKYNTKIWASDCFAICSKDVTILDNVYLYYYLMHIQDKIYKCQTGAAQPHVYSSSIDKIVIPVSSIEFQKHVVGVLNTLNDEKNLIMQEIHDIDILMTDILELSFKSSKNDLNS